MHLVLIGALLATLLPSSCQPVAIGTKWAKVPISYSVDSVIREDVTIAIAAWQSPGVLFVEDSSSMNRFIVGKVPIEALLYENQPAVTYMTNTIAGELTSFAVIVDTELASNIVPLLVHEIGHVIGLNHPKEFCFDSVMSYWGSRELYPGDKVVRDSIYPANFAIYLPYLQ